MGLCYQEPFPISSSVTLSNPNKNLVNQMNRQHSIICNPLEEHEVSCCVANYDSMLTDSKTQD